MHNFCQLEENIKTIIGKNIKIARKSRSIEISDLAYLLDISESDFQKYEKGKKDIDASKLFLISAILGEPIEKFFKIRTRTN